MPTKRQAHRRGGEGCTRGICDATPGRPDDEIMLMLRKDQLEREVKRAQTLDVQFYSLVV
jgi:hypothetical protein